MSDDGLNVGDVDLLEKTGFILAEEQALKEYLTDRLRVPARSGRPPSEVPVEFRWVSSEKAISYPNLILDLISVDPAYDLWHSQVDEYLVPAEFEDPVAGTTTFGHYYPSTTPDATPNMDVPDSPGYYIGSYLPYRLMFQISSWANNILQDRYIMSKLLTHILGPRSFFIPVAADQVLRRCELVSWSAQDTLESTEATKRQLHKVYTITMETEIPSTAVLELAKVRKLHIDFYDKSSPDPRLLPGHNITSPAHAQLPDTLTIEPTPSGT